MWDLFWTEIVLGVAGIVVIAVAFLVTFGLNKLNQAVGKYLDIDIVEWEVYHVARSLRRLKGDYEDLWLEILQTVRERLERRGIKIEEDELRDVIDNTLEDLQKEDEEE